MNKMPDTDLQFRPDFAMRVLEAADRLVTRRRRVRRFAGASVLCAGIAAAAVWLNLSAAQQGASPGRNPMFASTPLPYGQTGSPSAEQNTSADALSWFFPDAEPLARYAAEDAPDDSGNSAGALFADDE